MNWLEMDGDQRVMKVIGDKVLRVERWSFRTGCLTDAWRQEALWGSRMRCRPHHPHPRAAIFVESFPWKEHPFFSTGYFLSVLELPRQIWRTEPLASASTSHPWKSPRGSAFQASVNLSSLGHHMPRTNNKQKAGCCLMSIAEAQGCLSELCRHRSWRCFTIWKLPASLGSSAQSILLPQWGVSGLQHTLKERWGTEACSRGCWAQTAALFRAQQTGNAEHGVRPPPAPAAPTLPPESLFMSDFIIILESVKQTSSRESIYKQAYWRCTERLIALLSSWTHPCQQQ